MVLHKFFPENYHVNMAVCFPSQSKKSRCACSLWNTEHRARGQGREIAFCKLFNLSKILKTNFFVFDIFLLSKKSMQDMLSAFITGFNQQTIQGIWKSIYKVSTFVDARYWRVNDSSFIFLLLLMLLLLLLL